LGNQGYVVLEKILKKTIWENDLIFGGELDKD